VFSCCNNGGEWGVDFKEGALRRNRSLLEALYVYVFASLQQYEKKIRNTAWIHL